MPENIPPETHEALLIGGPADGRRERVTYRHDVWKVAVPPPWVGKPERFTGPMAEDKYPLETHIYNRVQIPGHRHVFLHESLNCSQMMDALIDRYPRPFPPCQP